MYEESPFTKAKDNVDEAAAWLREMLLPEGDPARECDANEDSWEQATHLLTRAVDVLNEQGREHVEVGGEEVAGFGWVPRFRSDIIDPQAVAAADGLQALLAPLIALEAGAAALALSASWIEQVQGLLPSQFGARLFSEAEMRDSQPEPG